MTESLLWVIGYCDICFDAALMKVPDEGCFD